MDRLCKIAVTTALLCASSVVSFGQVKNRIVQPIDKSQMVRLKGNVHPFTQRGEDLGRVNGAMRLNRVSLFFGPSPGQKAALQGLLKEQQDPASPNYHKWVKPEEYADRFGMSGEDIAKVTAWLKTQGFKVDEVSRSRDRVSFSGSVANIEAVFQTELHNYKVNGEKHFANATELSVPSAIAGAVLGIHNLDDFRWKPRVRPTPHFTSSLTGNTFLAPADVATIYNLNTLYNSGIDGTGQSIAVAGQTLIDLNDVSNFRTASGLAQNPPVLVLMPNSGAAQTFTSDEVESDLDVQWSGAIAKKAKIIFVFTGNSPNLGVVNAFFYAIDNDVAPIVSMSYGSCETSNGASFIPMLQAEAQKANLQGQTIVSAVGDAGATDCEASNATIAVRGISVDAPAVLQEVTGVGGTTFTGDDNHNPTFWNASNDPLTGGSAIKYIPETTWNDGFGSSTGGGVSTIVAKPDYQSALTPADGHRDVPDVALSASPAHDPYLLCDVNHSDATHGGACTDGFRDASTTLVFAAGGTSFGAPEFAGMLALINQATENAAGSGNVNLTLYTLAAMPGVNAFHDITTGNNKQLCQGGSTGCTSANSHNQVAETRSGLPAYAGLFLIPLGAVVLSAGRRRWAAFLGMLLMVAAFSVQIACGGGSSNNNNNNNNPPPNLSIGWSAGTGYDVVTGLGSVDGFSLASAWLPGGIPSPAFSLSGGAIVTTTTMPGTSSITLTSSTFSGNVDLSCVATGDLNGDPLATCSLNPPTRTLNSGAQTTSTLMVNASHAGTYSVLVIGQSGAISHSVNVPVTVN